MDLPWSMCAMIEKLRMRFNKARNPCERLAVEMILADELAVIFDDGDLRGIRPFPVVSSVNIVDNDLEAAPHQRQQLLNHYLTEMASLPAIYIDGLQQSLSIIGVKRRRQLACRTRQRLITSPKPRPSNAAMAALASPSEAAYAITAPARAPSIGIP